MNDQSHYDSNLAGHEPIEANVRAVWITGGVLASVVAGTFLVILGLMAWLEATPARSREMQAESNADAKMDPDWNVPPQLQQLRTKEQQFVNTYGWVDQPAGVARIPLDRAFEIITENGLPETIGADASSAEQTTNGR
jgi:hypothetical protein